jgi:membrane protein YqaA with SNARE-associated domain
VSEGVDEQAPASSSRRARIRALVAVLAVVALNVVTYALLATDTAQRLIASVEDWAYAGAFVLSLLTNLTLAVPVPYNPIIIQLMVAVQLPFLIAVLAAAGSALGESTGWWVGSQGRAVLPTHGRTGSVVRWLQRVSARRTTAFWALAAFSAVPNPVFDVAGLVAGAAKVPYPLFLVATFDGRLVRFSLFALFGQALLDVWPF